MAAGAGMLLLPVVQEAEKVDTRISLGLGISTRSAEGQGREGLQALGGDELNRQALSDAA